MTEKIRNLPKILKKNINDIEKVTAKTTIRERKICPECGSLNIDYKKRTKNFICGKCFNIFKNPKKKMINHINCVATYENIKKKK